jgi:hypothetical protein
VFTVDNLNDSGAGSLRDAMLQANSAAGADEIVFAGAATSGVIGLTSGQLLVTDSLTLTGPGRDELTIASQGLGRIINFTAVGGTESSGDLSLSGLTLRDGLVAVQNPLDGGGAIRFLSSGQLTIDACTLTNNRITSGLTTGAPSGGGAVFTTAGTITINQSTVQGNSATGPSGGALRIAGGGIYAVSGDVVINDSSLRDNTATLGQGGAVAIASGSLSLTDTAVVGNNAGHGGGVATESGQITLLRSELSANVADGSGGGLYGETGDVTLIQSVVATNTGGSSGGIHAEGGNLTLQFCVVSGNSSDYTGGISWRGGFNTPGTRFLLEHSQVIGNRGEGAVEGGGLGLSGDATVSHSIVSANSVRYEGSPFGGGILHRLGTLTINDSEITSNYLRSTLLNGGRPQGAGIAALGAETLIVRSNVSDNYFEWDGQTPQSFRGGVGAGIYARFTGSSPGLGVSPRSSLTIRESKVSGNTIANTANGTSSGGGIYAYHNVNVHISNSAIYGNTAQSLITAKGGGITASRLTLVNSTVSGNTTSGDGGGVYVPDNSDRDSVLIVNSTLTGNVAARGGGIYLEYYSRLRLANAIIAGNTATAGPDLSVAPAAIVGVDNSLIGDTAGSMITPASGVGNVLNQPAGLGPLQDNGGPTPTHTLLPGSPAINAGDILDLALYDYRLDGSLSDAHGAGSDLVAQGGMLAGDYFQFNSNEGLSGQIPASEADDYSLEFWFKMDQVGTDTGYRKLVDFSTGANPLAGLYVHNGRLRYVINTTTGFYTGTQPILSSTWHHVALTRSVDTSGGSPVVEIKTYVDGLFDKSYPESFMGHALAVFSQQGATADTRLVNMFQGGNGFGEVGAGEVDRIRFYDFALPQTDVATAYATSLLSDFDQRGAGFPRTIGGQIDIGSFEAQTAVQPPELPGDYNVDGTVDAADYTVWRNALGTSGIEPYSGADGDGSGKVEAADYDVWKSQFGQTLMTGTGSGVVATTQVPMSPPAAVSADAVDTAFAIYSLPIIQPAGSRMADIARPMPSSRVDQALLLLQHLPATRSDSALQIDAIASHDKASSHAVPETLQKSVFFKSSGEQFLDLNVHEHICTSFESNVSK